MVYQPAQVRNALFVSDLFYTILDYFHPELNSTDQRALVALALTCRALSEPSLDRLWRKLRSVEPLIRSYSNDINNLIPPTSEQFAIIRRYAHRVRELTVEGSLSERFLQYTSMQTSCLLPNLTVLDWNPYRSDQVYIPTNFIQQLLSPTLISIRANFAESGGAALLSFFNSYPLLCRNLKSVRFELPTKSTTMHALSWAICRLNTLENVTIHAPIDHTALSHVSTLPTLKVLAVTLSETPEPQTHSLLHDDMLFSSVKELEFEASSLDLVANLLRPRDQIFDVFRLKCNSRVPSEAVLAFLNVLASRPHTKPLRNLKLTIGDFIHRLRADQMESDATRYRLSYQILQPLMVFGSLRYLMIEWGEQISLDDDEVASLVQSWPLLEVFVVDCHRGPYPRFSIKYPTLRSLLSLVSSCPRLQTVCLPLDARQVPQVEDAGPYETRFSWLSLPESPIDDPLPVAEFLYKYLPYVTDIDARFIPMGPDAMQLAAYEQAWEQVQRHLGEFNGYMSDALELASVSSDEEDDD